MFLIGSMVFYKVWRRQWSKVEKLWIIFFVEILSSKSMLIVCDSCDKTQKMTKNPTMPQTNQLKHLGVGASCTVQLHFLHPKEYDERGHPEPDSNTATEWVDCPIKGGEIHPSGGQGVHHVSKRELLGANCSGPWREVSLWIQKGHTS